MIRLGLVTDLPAINAFDIFAGNRLLEIVDDQMLVIEADGRVVGYISWLPRGFVGNDYITHLGVAPFHQRRGVGRALLRAAEVKIPRGRVFVSANENNDTMLALLAAEGWTQAGQVAGVNEDGRAEIFFCKDCVPAAP